MKRYNAKVTVAPANIVVTCMRLVVLCGHCKRQRWREDRRTQAQVESAVAAARRMGRACFVIACMDPFFRL